MFSQRITVWGSVRREQGLYFIDLPELHSRTWSPDLDLAMNDIYHVVPGMLITWKGKQVLERELGRLGVKRPFPDSISMRVQLDLTQVFSNFRGTIEIPINLGKFVKPN